MICNDSNCPEGREDLRDFNMSGRANIIICIDSSPLRRRRNLRRVLHRTRDILCLPPLAPRLFTQNRGSAKKFQRVTWNILRSQLSTLERHHTTIPR